MYLLAMLAGCGDGKREALVPENKIAWYALTVHPYVAEVPEKGHRFREGDRHPNKASDRSELDTGERNANVDSLVAQDYTAFSIYPSDASAANGLYGELVANGAHVVSYGAPTVLPTPASFLHSYKCEGSGYGSH